MLGVGKAYNSSPTFYYINYAIYSKTSDHGSFVVFYRLRRQVIPIRHHTSHTRQPPKTVGLYNSIHMTLGVRVLDILISS